VTDPATYKTRTFTAASAGDTWAGPVTYTFDFGDGQRSAPQSTLTATHTYAADGDYTVTVTATTADGRSARNSMGVIVLPRSRPDIVIASNPIAADGTYYMEVQPTSASPNGYIPQGMYTFNWGDGTPAWTGGANLKKALGTGHVYQDPTINPTTTITLVDNAGWEWKWTYTSRTDTQSPAISSPPSPGGWVVGSPPPPPNGGPGPGPGSARPVVQRLGGSDRYATARAVSAAQWPDGRAAAVVLARGDKAPDALAGVPLAARKGGPLLLTDPAALDTATRGEIDRVLGGPGSHKPIYLLGGASAVSPTIEQDLRRAGYNVQRLSGTDRYSTALAIAGQFPAGHEVIVATGLDFPDALAAGPLAAQRNAPIVLSNGTTIDPATAAFLRGKQVLDAVGGAAVKAAHTLPGVSVHEYAGADRFATAITVANALTASLGHPVTGAGVAYAFNFPDALTGGAYAATAGQPLLLTDSASSTPETLNTLHGLGPALANIEIFGGTAVVSQTTEDQITRAVNGTEK
jgi:putative cell wall-binding protein